MQPILENIPLGKQSILAFRYSGDGFDTPWHFHPEHELVYIEESVGTKFVGDFVGDYQPGELVLLRANLPHCWKNFSSSSSRAISTVIQWKEHCFADVPELSDLDQMMQKASHGIIFSSSAVDVVRGRVLKLPSLSAQELYVQLLSILLDLPQYQYSLLSEVSFRHSISGENKSRMARIHDYVAENYSRKVYLSELATFLNMSEQSFSRFFSRLMGRPFFTFLNEYRISVASRMLLDSDLLVTEIAYACGYDTLPFFYKQFQKYKKMSPMKFRNKYKLL